MQLIEEKAFSDFRGLIYFTDGRGIYPFAAPGYDTMFVFKVDAADEVPSVPWWAIKVVI